MVGCWGTGGPQAVLKLGELLSANCRMPSVTSKLNWAGCSCCPVGQCCPGSSAGPQHPARGWCSPNAGIVPGQAFGKGGKLGSHGCEPWDNLLVGGAEITERCDIHKPASRSGNPSRKSSGAGIVPGRVQTCPAPLLPGHGRAAPARLCWGPRRCHLVRGLCPVSPLCWDAGGQGSELCPVPSQSPWLSALGALVLYQFPSAAQDLSPPLGCVLGQQLGTRVMLRDMGDAQGQGGCSETGGWGAVLPSSPSPLPPPHPSAIGGLRFWVRVHTKQPPCLPGHPTLGQDAPASPSPHGSPFCELCWAPPAWLGRCVLPKNQCTGPRPGAQRGAPEVLGKVLNGKERSAG